MKLIIQLVFLLPGLCFSTSVANQALQKTECKNNTLNKASNGQLNPYNLSDIQGIELSGFSTQESDISGLYNWK